MSRDVRAGSLTSASMPEVFVPLAQNPWPAGCILVRTDVPPEGVVQALRSMVGSIDRDQPLTYARSMRQSRAMAFRIPRILTGIVGSLGAVALLLSVMGVYGLVSYSVAQRRQELGVRIALGASPADLVRLLIRQGLVPVAIGGAIGLAGAFAIRKLMTHALFGLNGRTGWEILPAVLLLAIVACCACYLPARRAAGGDPAEALRVE